MHTALVADEGVNLVYDDCLHGAEHHPRDGAGEDQVEGLGRGDEDMGRVLDHPSPDGLGSIARADQHVETG